MTPPFGLPGGEGYDFDAGGNRQGSGGTPQSATGTHNQLQTDGVYNYFYDGEGNLIRRESLSNAAATLYEWDHRNRLVSVKEAPFYQVGPIYQNMIARRIEYIYDAFDQRVGRRIEDTGAGYGIWGIEWKRYEAYVWADGQEVLRFTDSDGLESAEPFRLANRYLWSNQVDQLLAEEQYTGNSGPAIDAPAAHPSEGETFWPLTDHLGSVRGLVDNNGVIRQHVTYDSFGNRLVEQHYDSAGAPVTASHAEAVDTLFGYTGRAWDADTGLQYNRARWYDPSTGRWLSQDPIGFAAGDANLYRYVGNGVTMRVDPSGLKDLWWWWYDNRDGSELNINQFPSLQERIQNSVAAQLAMERMLDEALEEALDVAVSQGPNTSGRRALGARSELARFAGNKLSKVIGAAIEGISGSTYGNNQPFISGTSLYVLGDSNLIGSGHFVWHNTPVQVQRGFGIMQLDDRTSCGTTQWSEGYWATVTVTLSFRLNDSFEEPYRVTNGGLGTGIETGTPYAIVGTLGSRTASRSRWVETGSGTDTLWERVDCLR